jgi:hypothetical protein
MNGMSQWRKHGEDERVDRANNELGFRELLQVRSEAYATAPITARPTDARPSTG